MYVPINPLGYSCIKKLQRDNLWHAYNEPINIYSVCSTRTTLNFFQNTNKWSYPEPGTYQHHQSLVTLINCRNRHSFLWRTLYLWHESKWRGDGLGEGKCCKKQIYRLNSCMPKNNLKPI